MDLELPNTAECLLCNRETVELHENNSGKPYLYCNTFETAVNLRDIDSDEPQSILKQALEDAEPDSAESESTELDESESTETKTLADILKENKNDG